MLRYAMKRVSRTCTGYNYMEDRIIALFSGYIHYYFTYEMLLETKLINEYSVLIYARG